MNHGVLPVKKDHRDFSYHRTFGAVTPTFPEELNLSAGLPPINENATGLDNSCTGITQSSICSDEDKVRYDFRYTYDKTLNMMGIFQGSPQWEDVGCDLRTSLASTIVYGVDKGDGNPLSHRRGAYYAIEQIAGSDWFDTFRQVLLTNKRPISIASPWFPEMSRLVVYKVIGTPENYDVSRASWHNYECVGWDTFAGQPYLLIDAWLGDGVRYMPREVINNLMAINGSGAFTLAPITANPQTVILTLYETVISYLTMWRNALQAKIGGII